MERRRHVECCRAVCCPQRRATRGFAAFGSVPQLALPAPRTPPGRRGLLRRPLLQLQNSCDAGHEDVVVQTLIDALANGSLERGGQFTALLRTLTSLRHASRQSTALLAGLGLARFHRVGCLHRKLNLPPGLSLPFLGGGSLAINSWNDYSRRVERRR